MNPSKDVNTSLQTFRKIDNLPPFIHEYLLSKLSLGYSKHTLQRYIYDFLAFFQFIERVTAEENFQTEKITLADFLELEKDGIEHYIRYLSLELENEATTVNRKVSALQSLFQFLVQRGDTAVNPVLSVQRPKIGKTEPVYLTNVELKTLLIWLKQRPNHSKRKAYYEDKLKERDFIVFYLLISTGLRISELAHLSMKQIDFHQQQLKIKGKGNKERSIPLSGATVQFMQTYIKSLPSKNRPQAAGDLFLLGYDFTKKTYVNGVSISALQKMLKRTLDEAKHSLSFLSFKQISAHKLRHSFATELVANGTDVLTVQSLLGHESVSTTQVYAHVQQQARQKAIDSLRFEEGKIIDNEMNQLKSE
ncbi:integrase [Alkalihalobacillus pseudalcaliphilus]|nr:integrase [Alkalihalobacillus pseudalcaliphilus]